MMEQQSATPPAATCCVKTRYEVRRADLPVHCPTDEMSLWNAHPRVYIPLQEIGDEGRCPYCSAVYVLVDG
jgi:uncharacterized Zn-finger protein